MGVVLARRWCGGDLLSREMELNLTAEDHHRRAVIELEAAAATKDPGEKRRRFDQAASLATAAELARKNPSRTEG